MGAIFISYRREDTGGDARSLFYDLRAAFGVDSVFMDVVDIEPGVDFRKTIDTKVAGCSALLALMGQQWLHVKNDDGQRRLDDAADFVRLETAGALRRDIKVIPVLVQGAKMPAPAQLPDDLKDLAFRHGVELTHARWESDVQVLVQKLSRHVKPLTPPAPSASGTAAAARYRAKAEQALADGKISPLERKTLNERRDELGLTPEEATAIEASLTDYSRKLAQYRQDLAETIEQEYPLSEPTKADLQQRRVELGLEAEDARRLEAELLKAADSRHRAQQQQAEEAAKRAQAETEQRALEAALSKAQKETERRDREIVEQQRKAAKAAQREAEQRGADLERQRLAAVAQQARPQSAAQLPQPAKVDPPASQASIGTAVTGGERLQAAGVGAVACAASAFFALVFGGNVSESFIGGSAIWGAIAGAISTSYRGIAGLAVILFIVGLFSTS